MKKDNLSFNQFVKEFFVGESNVDINRAKLFYKEYLLYESCNVSFKAFKCLMTGKS